MKQVAAYLGTVTACARPKTLPGHPSGISVEDWDTLFSTVTARLRSIVSVQPAEAPDPQANDMADRVRTSVMECAAAMEQLHEELTHQRGGRLQLEEDIVAAQSSLA